MNRSHLWKFLIIILVVAWSASEMMPPKGRPLIEAFRELLNLRRAALELFIRIV